MALEAAGLALPGRLHGITTRLKPGEVTVICGPNGAGKSTLLAVLAGLVVPADGAVTLGGRPLSVLTPRARAMAVGYLPQDGEVAWNVSVETLVRLGRLPHRTGAAEDDAAVARAIAALGLAPLATRALHTLSGGERARALLARVLAGEPRWVLADEPLAALDLAHQQALLAQFRALAEQGAGVVLVVHDLAQAMNHADRVIVLDRGVLVDEGAPADCLTADLIARVWGVRAQWAGEPGAQALALLR